MQFRIIGYCEEKSLLLNYKELKSPRSESSERGFWQKIDLYSLRMVLAFCFRADIRYSFLAAFSMNVGAPYFFAALRVFFRVY